ncbi:MAG: preprotein translocase subunit SecG [Rhizobiales bacterium]|nr:preprotein translocase subunit SecG [Hyphomicrobiales bacterium]
MLTVILVIHLIIALALIGVVLLQRSEGGALGIGSGGGAGSLFSARGVGNTLTRVTAGLAVAFFITSITLTVLSTKRTGGGSVFDSVPTTQQAPAGQTPDGNDGTVGGSVLPNLPPSKSGGQNQVPVTP